MSLASRFLVTLVATAVLPLVLYGWLSLRGMRGQIEEQAAHAFLPQLAADHAARIEAHFRQVDQSCAVVREIARLALRDPSAMAEFEEQVELVPDLLDNFLDLLLIADPQGNVVSWRDGLRLDPSAHGVRAARIPNDVRAEAWFQQVQEQRGAQYGPWARSAWISSSGQALDPASYHVSIALDVPQAGGRPGALLALLRWAEVQRIVDEARAALVERAHWSSAEVFLADPAGVIVAHTDRSRYGSTVNTLGMTLSPLLAGQVASERCVASDGIVWRVGLAMLGKGERELRLGVAVPELELLAASTRFQQAWLLAIAATVVVLVLWSLWASRFIVRPVRALVVATRRVGRGDRAVAVAARGGPELGELATSFNQMASELEAGRARLAAAERDQAWAEMARQVAHEIKNPLQPMRLAAELLQSAMRDRDPRTDAIAQRLARTVLEQTTQLTRIAESFRAMAGIALAACVEVTVDDWLMAMCERQRDLLAGRLQLQVVPGAEGARVSLDLGAMERVFGNLIQNAVDASVAAHHVIVASQVAGDEVWVTVTDDGAGVAEEARSKLFDPYFTTKSSGTGLGLAICRRTVEAHGGSIGLMATRAGETVFRISLPRLLGR